MKFAYFNPTVMAIADIPVDLFTEFKELADQAHEYKHLNDVGNPNISVRGGSQIQLVPNEINLNIDRLRNFIENQCQVYIDSITKQSNRPDLANYKPVLVSAWTIKQNSGNYQALHTHEAHISGNMYLEVPDLDPNSETSDANIEFRLPVIRNPANFIFVDQFRFPPQIMKMIIFPSYIPHTVYPWRGQGHRTVLAWDVKLVQK